MAEVDSNLPEIAALLRGLGDIFNLSRPRRGGRRLGDEAADAIAAGIQARSIQGQQAPDGSAWPRLARSTRVRKARLGQPDTIGVATGEMLEFEQVRGQVAMNEDSLVMEAGLDAEAKAKFAYFQEGDPKRNRPPRDLYALDEQIEKDLGDLFDEAADERIRDLGGE